MKSIIETGVGYALALDKLLDTAYYNSKLIFRPLNPSLESGLTIIWKKSQIFSPAAKLFLEKLKAMYGTI